MSNIASKTLTDWIDSLVFHVHDDSVINDAIMMYARPWREPGWEQPAWGHDILESAKTNHQYLTSLAAWLCVDIAEIDPESAKGLAMFSGPVLPWNISENDPYLSSRRISTELLAAAFKRLDIELTEHLPIDQRWNLPITPALPFIIALREFLQKVIANGGRPTEIYLRRYESAAADLYTLVVAFSKYHKDLPADPWGLVRKHVRQRATGFTGVCAAYEHLLYCRTADLSQEALNSHRGQGWISVFTGFGLDVPCVGTIPFKHGICLCWTSQPKPKQGAQI